MGGFDTLMGDLQAAIEVADRKSNLAHQELSLLVAVQDKLNAARRTIHELSDENARLTDQVREFSVRTPPAHTPRVTARKRPQAHTPHLVSMPPSQWKIYRLERQEQCAPVHQQPHHWKKCAMASTSPRRPRRPDSTTAARATRATTTRTPPAPDDARVDAPLLFSWLQNKT